MATVAGIEVSNGRHSVISGMERGQRRGSSRAPDRCARRGSGETIELEVAEGAGLLGMADRGVTAAGVLELEGLGGVAVRFEA